MLKRADIIALAKAEEGIPVWSCTPGSPSERAGVRYGDIILEINGKRVRTIGDYLEESRASGETFQMTVRRGGELLNFEIERRRDLSGADLVAEARKVAENLNSSPLPLQVASGGKPN